MSMTKAESVAWLAYCAATWPPVAKDFWWELSTREKEHYLRITKPTVDKDYWA